MKAERGTVAAVSCNDTYAFIKPVRGEIVLIAGVGVKGDVHAGLYVKHRGRVRNDPTQPNFRQVHLIQQELFGEVGAKGYDVEAGNLGENVTTSGVDLLGLPRGTILRFGPAAGECDSAAGAGGPAAGAGGPAAGEGGAEAAEGARETVPAVGAGSGSVGAGGALAAVLEVAAAAELGPGNAGAAVAIAAAAARDRGDDPRPAVVVAGLRNPCGQINGFRDGLLKEVLGRDERGQVVRKAGVMAVVLRGGPIRTGDMVTVELPPAPHAPLEPI
ncbi:MOSC domain-containing protein [Paractinoplanes durhamensis]|uniref:MOSC domain-containing protein n=1 Tax=Paractinoplanes durhamensis TaxID=113563 RepID=A0ABQ3Z8C2_9ACTN|nr:transcription elongation factor [Actinoplanes durhamensis]GIE06070.1 hypothetical protein Adu01nite_74200 [Actinoplanes durhamensis]